MYEFLTKIQKILFVILVLSGIALVAVKIYTTYSHAEYKQNTPFTEISEYK